MWPAVSRPLLVLFDIDGTLLLDDAGAHERAMLAAMRTAWGLELPDDAVRITEPWGKTDRRILREVLHGAGVADRDIDARRHEWMRRAGEAFEREAASSSDRWVVRAGLADALDRLATCGMRLTLVTGNLSAIAATKVKLIGVARRLELEAGAYGSDEESRSRLVPLARARAEAGGEPWPSERTVVVGDTPRDVAGALADGVASIAFSSARFGAADLRGARAVVSDVEALVEKLTCWVVDGSPASP